MVMEAGTETKTERKWKLTKQACYNKHCSVPQ